MDKLHQQWPLVPLNHFLTKVRRGIDVQPQTFYSQIGIRSWGKGIFHKEPMTGEEIGGKHIFWIEPGDFVLNIVFAWEGAVALVSENEKGMCASHRFPTFVPDRTLCDAEYLLRYFQTPLGVEQLGLCSPGGAGRNRTLNQSDFLSLSIPLPPLAEQRKIAAILGTWDAAIASVQQLIAALQARKQGLMQRLLTGEVRFPEFAGSEWQRKRLGDLFERVNRKNTSGSTNVLTASAQYGLVSQLDYFKRSVAGADLANYYLLKKGEFAYNRSSSDGYPFGAIKQLEGYDEGILSTLYICFRLMDGAGVADFYKHYFESGGLDQGIYMIAQEGARNHGLLNVGLLDFFDLDIVVPTFEEQRRIAEVFELQEQLIAASKHRHAAIVKQKQALMQQLLTGQVRVKVAEDAGDVAIVSCDRATLPASLAGG